MTPDNHSYAAPPSVWARTSQTGARRAPSGFLRGVTLLFACGSLVGAWLVAPPGPVLGADEPTPIIEPVPVPVPIFLPLAQRAFKASAPEPLDNQRQGYLTSLSAAGREACAPGRYVLLDKPEGRLDAKAVAVLYSGQGDLNLDLFVGEAVRLSGLLAQAPAGCRVFTAWLIQVEKIERIDLPPGH